MSTASAVRSQAVARFVRANPRLLVGAGALALAIGVGAVVWAAAAGAGPSGEPAAFAQHASLSLSAGRKLEAPPSQSAIVGTRFVPGKGKAGGRTVELGGGDRIAATLTGSLVPVAVESADGSLVAYSSWRLLADIKPDLPGQGLKTGEPLGITSVRVYDGAAGKDRLLALGAHSPALSRDGRLAFVQGDEKVMRWNEPYTGKVMVGSPTKGDFTPWTTQSGKYFPYAWAGDTLLVYRALPDSEATDLYAYTGPGQSRLVAPMALVVALSPDGERALITQDRRMVEVIRISDGAVEASMPLDGSGVATAGSPTTPHVLMYSGSWRGDRVVANSDVGLVVLNVAEGIRIESIMATPGFAHGLVEPTFTNDTHVIGWANLAGSAHTAAKNVEPLLDNALVSCDLAAGSCASGDARPGSSWTRWVGNPSR